MIGNESHDGNGVNLIFHLLWPSGFGQDLSRAHILSSFPGKAPDQKALGETPWNSLCSGHVSSTCFFQKIQSHGYKESQPSAFFLSSFSADRKEITSFHLHMESIFPREKKNTLLSKSAVLSILLLFTKRSYLTIQAKIGILLISQYQDLNETELGALSTCHTTLPLKVLQQLVLSSQHWSLLHPGGVRAPSMAHSKGRTERFLATVLFPWELHEMHSIHPQGCWSQCNLPILPLWLQFQMYAISLLLNMTLRNDL